MALRFGEDHGRQVGTSTIEMLPGETTEIIYTVLGPANVGQPGDVPPTLVVTPGVNPTVTSVDPYQTCAVGRPVVQPRMMRTTGGTAERRLPDT